MQQETPNKYRVVVSERAARMLVGEMAWILGILKAGGVRDSTLPSPLWI